MADRVTPETRSRMMASIRSRDTKPELIVRRYLHRAGFRYRISPRTLPGRPDIVLRRHRVAVFVHGCFWHGHQGCRFARIPTTRTAFWADKISSNRVRDGAKEALLIQSDWRVAVVWECALKGSQDTALQRLVAFILADDQSIDISA